MKLKEIGCWMVIIICMGFLLFVLWALWFGPLKECPIHPKDPNTGQCMVSKP